MEWEHKCLTNDKFCNKEYILLHTLLKIIRLAQINEIYCILV